MNSREAVLILLRQGQLIPVELSFNQEDEEDIGYCLSDKTEAGSDCFKAEKWLLRLSDELMNDLSIQETYMTRGNT